MKILVTGGAGFIGSHLCEKLVRIKDCSVVGIDNFDPLYPASQKEQNLSWLKQQADFLFIEADIRQEAQMATIFSNHQFDHVFHLAGRGGIPQSTLHPFLYLDEIMLGTMVMLEFAIKNHVKIFINASSSSVYGHMQNPTSSERAVSDKPLSVYAALKKSSELLSHAYHALYGIGVVNVRFFSVYGPRGRHDQIIYKITHMIDMGIPVPEIQPDPARDFTYVGDIVNGLIRLLNLPARCYELMNLGYGKPQPINRVITLVEQALGKRAIRGEVMRPLPSDTAITHANSARAKKLLGWEPVVPLEQGIPLFIEWYQSSKQEESR